MKKITLAFAQLLFAAALMAQVPAGMNYQAVVRNSEGEAAASQAVRFRFSLLRDNATGTAVYVETRQATTNEFGLVNLEVGMGTPVSGTLDAVEWGEASYFLKVELDPAGGSSFSHLGTTQLLAVPYAFHAKTAESITGTITETDPKGVSSASVDGTNTKILTLTLNDASTVQAQFTDMIGEPGEGDNWGEDYVHTDATLAGLGTTAAPLKIAQQSAATGQVLKWNGTNWLPADDEFGSSLWQQSGSDIYFNSGKVGIGKIPGADARQFQVLTEAKQAIAGVNNSASYATIFGQNLGAGPAADFRNRIRIADGTEGTGKVLTSDANGYSSWLDPAASPWQKSGDHVYYNTGNVGIGFTNPSYDLDIRDLTDHSLINLKAITNKDAIMYIDKGGAGRYSAISFMDQATLKFWIGLLTNNNFRISTHYSSLNGMEITSDGDANFTGMLNINKGVASGQALLVNSKEAIWFDGTYFSWGYGGTANYFRNKIFVGATYATPSQMLDVNGNARFRSIGSGAYAGVVNRTSDGTLTTATSDERLKENISSLQNSLDKIMQLRGVSFTWKTNPEYGTRIGFIAQEFEKVIPELVFTNEVDGYKGINYAEVTAVIVEAVKEQQKIIEDLKTENEKLKAENKQFANRLEKLENSISAYAEKE